MARAGLAAHDNVTGAVVAQDQLLLLVEQVVAALAAQLEEGEAQRVLAASEQGGRRQPLDRRHRVRLACTGRAVCDHRGRAAC
eukprot:scaffold111894_cov90-Phaeocystis_antarctica.AAC.4